MGTKEEGEQEPNSAATEWRPIGAHWVRIEPPDIIHSRAVGVISPEDAHVMCDEITRLAAGGNRVVWLTDMARLTTVTPEARKAIISRTTDLGVAAILSYNGAFHNRVLLTLLVKGLALLQPSNELPPVRHFDTEAEARAWIDERRRGLQSRPDQRGTT